MTKHNALILASKWYGTKTNTSGTLLIDHVIETANLIEEALLLNSEGDISDADVLYKAALGHDLLEDTTISKQHIVNNWGQNVGNLVEKLTNAKGDSDFSRYINSLKTSEEEVVLLKFADILANVNNSVRQFKTIDKKWIKSFWVPLLEEYERRLFSYNFKKYPKTAAHLREKIMNQTTVLKKNL